MCGTRKLLSSVTNATVLTTNRAFANAAVDRPDGELRARCERNSRGPAGACAIHRAHKSELHRRAVFGDVWRKMGHDNGRCRLEVERAMEDAPLPFFTGFSRLKVLEGDSFGRVG